MNDYNLDINALGTHHYQPIVKNPMFWEQPTLEYLLGDPERDCLNRLNIIDQYIPDDSGTEDTFFDIGCNIGLFCHFFAKRKKLSCTGIDNNAHVTYKNFTKNNSIDTANLLNTIYGTDCNFIQGDYVEWVGKNSFDYINYLSVWHHHLVGYSRVDPKMKLNEQRAINILNTVCDKANKAIFFEADPKVYPYEQLEKILSNHGEVSSHDIDEQANLVKTYKFNRRLYVVRKT